MPETIKVKNLPAPINAAKADWLAGTTWIGFTPSTGDGSARAGCQSTIQKQFGKGYVLEYITEQFSQPNSGFEKDPDYLANAKRMQIRQAGSSRFTGCDHHPVPLKKSLDRRRSSVCKTCGRREKNAGVGPSRFQSLKLTGSSGSQRQKASWAKGAIAACLRIPLPHSAR